MKRLKNYGCKDFDMLLTAEVIAENLKSNLNVLSKVRDKWTEQYANDFIVRIHDAKSKYLSCDSTKTLRNATADVKSIMDKAIKNLTFFKIQVSVDFKKDKARRDEILETLGFKKYFKKASRRNQTALLQLLDTFKVNLTEDVKSLLATKGMSQIIIDEINECAETFKTANLFQENNKSSKKEFVQEKYDVLNEICDEAKGICKIAVLRYKDAPAKKEIFTFAKVLAQIANIRKAKGEVNIANEASENDALNNDVLNNNAQNLAT